ncbi:MAG: LCCL domain-containing protein [Pseudomonadota bacterium]
MRRVIYACAASPVRIATRSPSIVCQAAIHAGRITTAGGPVLVQMREGTPKLYGSERRGIKTHDGSGGSRTLSFPLTYPVLSSLD